MSNIRYFPYSPNIPWKINNSSKCVIPEISTILLMQYLSSCNNATVVAFGGLLESFLSLSIIEMINATNPGIKVLWSGNDQFKELVRLQGLASYNNRISSDYIKEFNTPIIKDIKDNVYFNALNNYLTIKNLDTFKYSKNYQYIFKQIYNNGLVPWNNNYIPKFRNLSLIKELDIWLSSNNIKSDTKLALIFPDKQFSIHSNSCLNWGVSNIKQFGKELKNKGICPIIITSFPNKYYALQMNVLEFNFNNILFLLNRSYIVVSEKLDILYLAVALSDTKIFTLPLKRHFYLGSYRKFLNKNNKINMIRKIKPEDIIKELNGK